MLATANANRPRATCKIKAVNPPLRSVSTPRSQNDLHAADRVYPSAWLRTFQRPQHGRSEGA
jgi:hypothetical protein